MLILPYSQEELRFAYCYHVYLRWNTHRARPFAALAQLDQALLQSLVDRFSLHTLECTAGATEVRALLSLQPHETVSACVSKVKGQTSRWLRETLGSDAPSRLLSKGYFACTSGKSEAQSVERYLEGQSEHHGYAHRVLPPIFVATYPLPENEEASLQPNHGHTLVQFHFVFATWHRNGVFAPAEGKAVAERWRELQEKEQFALLKVSFVPDHVHLAVRTHPAIAPAHLALVLMNAAQDLLWQCFADSIIQASVQRLWVRHEVADVTVLRSKDRLTAPAVLPAVSYRDMRPR